DEEKLTVLLVTWGSPEDEWEPWERDAVNDILKRAADRGVTVCCASGDLGANDQQNDNTPHVHFPASSPYVLAVGGTTLYRTADPSRFDEVVWNNGALDARRPFGGASGGGRSAFIPRPDWQKKERLPPKPSDQFDGRCVPDVAAHADLNLGYEVVFRGRRVPG